MTVLSYAKAFTLGAACWLVGFLAGSLVTLWPGG